MTTSQNLSRSLTDSLHSQGFIYDVMEKCSAFWSGYRYRISFMKWTLPMSTHIHYCSSSFHIMTAHVTLYTDDRLTPSHFFFLGHSHLTTTNCFFPGIPQLLPGVKPRVKRWSILVYVGLCSCTFPILVFVKGV